jgi:drug/metabolite transporter (DMT)-like permease
VFLEKPAQILAVIRGSIARHGYQTPQKLNGERMVNIGGRPVVIPARSTSRSSSPRSETVKLILAFGVIYLVWGSTYLAIRYAVETIPPLIVVGIRHTIAGIVLLVWAWVRGFRPRREHWISGLIVGALFFLIGHGSLHWAEQYVGSGLAALLIATEPIFILVLAWTMGEQRISGLSALGLAVGVAGVAILTWADLSTRGSTLLGVGAVLLGSISWAAGVVISPKLKLPSDALARTAVPLVCGAALVWIAAGATGEFQRLHWAGISLRSIGGLAYLVVFGSIIAFTCYMWLLQRCPPTLVATHTYANPVVAVLLGWAFASELLTWRVVISCVAILAAVMLIRRGEQSSAKTPHGQSNERKLGERAPSSSVLSGPQKSRFGNP